MALNTTDEVPGRDQVTVSVLMPTYRHEHFVARALGSLLAQTLTDWELIVVDDASPDSTRDVVNAFAVPRLRYLRHTVNLGLGAALNRGAAAATGRFLAYLPSDDYWDAEHLETCVAALTARPGAELAYAGLRWHDRTELNARNPVESATLRPDVTPGRERAVLGDPADRPCPDWPLASGNLLALVQVVHRREAALVVPWVERRESVSDALEADRWRGLLRSGAEFVHTGRVTCEWSDHPRQRHKIISGRGLRGTTWHGQSFGLPVYRQYYGLDPGVPLDWRPADPALRLDEVRRFAGLGPAAPGPYGPSAAGRAYGADRADDGLRILLVGSLGFNPERVLALREHGHSLSGLWTPRPDFWDTAGPLPFPGVRELPAADWRRALRESPPDLIYALLNWQALPFIHEVFTYNQRHLGIPFVFHFKESPMMAQRAGLWDELHTLVTQSWGRVFASVELREWFEAFLGDDFDRATTLVLDGDLPKRDWMTDDWSAKLSDTDGELHTVCVGRTVLGDVDRLAAHGIHLHLYAQPYTRRGSRWAGAKPGRHLHLHDPVRPQDWVAELSRYDAAWGHIVPSRNGGDLRRAVWNDLNLPARLGTYAAAGLPWIHLRNDGHRVAANRLGDRLDLGLTYDTEEELATLLRGESADRLRTRSAVRHRHELSFDEHTGTLVDFFRRLLR
ncbi:glycosyltransferase family 2 protein [Kitasatospora sp. NPDC056446]|uniref:glycosyltransferase family 2 protein n=1 Tax=Kitasatospora sp. NPDC056446 TaxID=3345819 RepID=UPI00367F36A4